MGGKGDACRRNLTPPPSTQARRKRWPSTPPILWPASGSAFTCCRDASTSTATRWGSSRATPRPRRCARWSSGRRSASTAGSARIRPGSPSARSWARSLAPLVGAEPDAVVVTGTTTVNQHALDRHLLPAARSAAQDRRHRARLPLRCLRPAESHPPPRRRSRHDLVLVPSRDGRTIAEEDVIAAMSDDVALALLPAVLYRSGQLLDIPRLAAAARARGIPMGFDCAHSIGAVPHRFDEWGVDWAFWCSYKYLNAGPGATGGLYVNRRHWGTAPGLAGWWGYDKSRQFDMVHAWQGAAAAGAWQISTPPLLATAPLRGSLRLFHEAGIDRAARQVAGPDRLPGAAPGGDRAHRAALRLRHRHPAPAGAARRPPRRRARRGPAHRAGAQGARRRPRLPRPERHPPRPGAALHHLSRAVADRSGAARDRRQRRASAAAQGRDLVA